MHYSMTLDSLCPQNFIEYDIATISSLNLLFCTGV